MNRLYDALPIFAQDWACTLEGWRRGRERFTPHFHDVLAQLERTVDLPLASLRALQARRLAQLVTHARRASPHYHALSAPSTAEDPDEAIRATLDGIPPLEKSVYRDSFEAIRVPDLPRRERVALKTSGTTGSAIPVVLSRKALAEWFAVAWRQRRQAGVSLADPHLTFGGRSVVPLRQTEPPFWRHNRAASQWLFSTYHLTRRFFPHYVDAVHALPARYVQGYPSALHLVARALLDAGRPMPRGRLLGVFTSSETLFEVQREAIERAFGAPVYDFYSATEAAVAMSSCSRGRLHVDMEFCIVEVDGAERGPDQERGQLLVTGFATEAAPLLRYRIGDVGTRSLSPCPCGRAGDNFLQIDGRIEDYIVTPDGRRIGRMDHVFKDQHAVAEAQLLQETSAALIALVVPRDGFDEAAEERLRAEIRSRVGPDLAIEIRRVDAIAREPNGKLRAVKSRVGALLG